MTSTTITSTHLVANDGARELAAQRTIADVLHRAIDLRTMMQVALEQIDITLDISRGLIYQLVDSPEALDEKCLFLVAWRGVSEGFLSQFSMMPLHGSVVAQAAAIGQPVVWDVTASPNLRLCQIYRAEGIDRMITVPLMVQGRLVGALNLGVAQERPLLAAELSFLTSVGQQISIALETARLRAAAERLTITGDRDRLTRTLHDSVIQNLYSMTLYAETIVRLLNTDDTTQAADYAQSLHAVSLEALHEMRLLISELHPPELAKIGLVAALQARLKALTGWGGITGELDADGGDLAGLLPLTVQQELYHIALEALNNAMKHAHARRIDVHLHFANGSAALEVRDDGIGFDPNAQRITDGGGLRSMIDRAQRIGGTLDIDTAPAQGTRIRATL